MQGRTVASGRVGRTVERIVKGIVERIMESFNSTINELVLDGNCSKDAKIQAQRLHEEDTATIFSCGWAWRIPNESHLLIGQFNYTIKY